jgi:hypothetical protein
MLPHEDAAEVPLNREQVLDELDFLASVEHSLCVEYLSVHCALGHDLDPAGAGATAQNVADAAQAAAATAQDEMRHLHSINRALGRAGRPPQLARASSIPGNSGSEVALGPLSLEQLERLIEREDELATAVDARYARLRRAFASPDLGFEGGLLDEMARVLDPLPKHSQLSVVLHEKLERIPPSEYLRATPHEPKDQLEVTLLELSDRSYHLLVGILQTWFAHEDEFFGGRDQAIDAMKVLDMINGLLVERGALPAFTPLAT